MRFALLLTLLLPSIATAGPHFDLKSSTRAFIDLGMVEATDKEFAVPPLPWQPKPVVILGGPTPADPSKDQGSLALGAFQYGLAVVLGLGIQGDSYQDRSRGEVPGLIRNSDVRGGYPIWSDKEQPRFE